MEGKVEKRLSKSSRFSEFLEKKMGFLTNLQEKWGDGNYNKSSSQNSVLDLLKDSHDGVLADDEAMENSVLYLSLLADHMNNYMKRHKLENRQNFNVQLGNLFNVSLFSTVISGGMILSACVQLMIIKSYFTGSLSWKIWQF